MARQSSRVSKMLLIMTVVLAGFFNCALSYNRPPPRETIAVRLSEDSDPTTPQQVHISMVGEDGMRISWITDGETPATVFYDTTPEASKYSKTGTTSSYKYMLYNSGQIHEVVVGPLQPDTVYYYRCGSSSSLVRNFKTPPAQLPVNFTVVGDLGQTGWTKSTLDHISQSTHDVLLLPGDLSYADSVQPLWDSFGRLVEPLASHRPWMVTQGNHEVEKLFLLHGKAFSAYNARWRMPFEESGSDSNLYYSFNVAGVHVIMLGSYADFDPNSAQYRWLQGDLMKVDRGKTPWLVVIVHAPWYNSNKAHQGESESVDMKKFMEDLIYKARADVVFAGHVHAYERFTRVYKDQADSCGPLYINIGDGGNREGLAKDYMDPQPGISLFREASFGHGEFQVVNATHALWKWQRNDDDVKVVADSVWVRSLSSDPACKSEL